MPLENFLFLQEQLFWAFGWLARWWLILFIVGTVAGSAFIFFTQVVSTWLERYSY